MSLPVSPTALVLVAICPHPRDLDIARTLGWYRIPYKTAPKTIAADTLALYTPSKFPPPDANTISWVADIRGHELVTRADLFRDDPTHPRAAELYFKLQLGPLHRLPTPIPAAHWKRLTFLYTTGDRLAAARQISDLTINGLERDLLYTALRERGLTADITTTPTQPTPTDPGLPLDLTILCALGDLQITTTPTTAPNTPSTLYLPPETIRTDPHHAADLVAQAVTRLGGRLGGPRRGSRPAG